MDELLRTCDLAVGMALSAGADEAEAFAATSHEVNAELQKNDIQVAKSMTSAGLGIRVFKNGSLGFSSVNSFGESEINEAVDRAVAIASVVPADEHSGLPMPAEITPIDGIYDAAIERYGVEHAVEDALTMLREAKGVDERVTIDGGGIEAGRGTKAVVNSYGVRQSERSSLIMCYIMGMARDGDAISSFDYQFDNSHRADGIDPGAAAREFAVTVISSLGAVSGESFKGTVVLAPKATTEIIVHPIKYSVLASAVQKGTSRFADKLGDSVASELITVTDDSRLENGFSTLSFDREGLPPSVLPLLESGVVRNFLYDSYTARRAGRSSTGHAGGGASSIPSVSATNVVMAGGAVAVEDMIAGVDRGVLVTRFSGNTDPASGDFSGVVKGGHMIRSGKLAEPLTGTLIAGNVFDLLPNVSAVSRETERLFNVVAPYVRLDGVSVTSG